MNAVVLNYLIGMGYIEAAEEFVSEMNPMENYQTQFEPIRDAINVKEEVAHGNISIAMQKIVKHSPDVFKNNPKLEFQLIKLKFLEHVGKGEIPQALYVATEELIAAVKAHDKELNEASLKEIEEAMCLLAFEDPKQSPYATLLLPTERLNLAKQIYQQLNHIGTSYIHKTNYYL